MIKMPNPFAAIAKWISEGVIERTDWRRREIKRLKELQKQGVEVFRLDKEGSEGLYVVMDVWVYNEDNEPEKDLLIFESIDPYEELPVYLSRRKSHKADIEARIEELEEGIRKEKEIDSDREKEANTREQRRLQIVEERKKLGLPY